MLVAKSGAEHGKQVDQILALEALLRIARREAGPHILAARNLVVLLVALGALTAAVTLLLPVRSVPIVLDAAVDAVEFEVGERELPLNALDAKMVRVSGPAHALIPSARGLESVPFASLLVSGPADLPTIVEFVTVPRGTTCTISLPRNQDLGLSFLGSQSPPSIHLNVQAGGSITIDGRPPMTQTQSSAILVTADGGKPLNVRLTTAKRRDDLTWADGEVTALRLHGPAGLDGRSVSWVRGGTIAFPGYPDSERRLGPGSHVFVEPGTGVLRLRRDGLQLNATFVGDVSQLQLGTAVQRADIRPTLFRWLTTRESSVVLWTVMAYVVAVFLGVVKWLNEA
jgi:hypothetical protein